MKKLTLLCAILMAVVFGTSCLSDDLIGGGKPSRPIEGGFLLDLKVENSSLNTRSTVPAEPGESDVNTLYLLFFDANGNEFIEAYDASPEGMDVLDMSSPIRVMFASTSQLNHSTPYKILLVANMDPYIDDMEQWLESLEGMSYSQAKSMVVSLDAGMGNIGISQNNLLMSTSVNRDGSGDVVQALLTRAVVRFDVDLKAPNYTLEYASVWNVAKTTGIWDDEFNDYSFHTEKFYEGFISDPLKIRGSLYAFENSATRSEQNDRHTTCLILGISSNDGPTTYYRVNVTSNILGQQFLRRNFVYAVSVNRVLAPGYNTPEDAYRGGRTFLDVSINNWNIDEQGLVLFDGDDVMAIPTNRIVFGPGTTGDTETREFQVFTYSPDPNRRLGISATLPQGIRAYLSGNTLIIEADGSSDTRSGHLELAFGNLRGIIAIEQTGAHEEFLDLSVGINGIPAFPLSANSEWPDNVKVTSSGPWTATLYNPEFKFIRHISGPAATHETAVGDDGDTFSVATASANGSDEIRFGFVVVALNSNPNINKVLMLNQNGQARIELSPEHREIVFGSDGTPVGTNTNVFDVTASLDWAVLFSGANASNFSWIRNGDGLTITAQPNRETIELHATARVYLSTMPNVAQTITLRQLPQTLVLSPTTVPSVPTRGGTTQPITVTSSQNWTVEIIGDNPFGASVSVGGGSNGDSFTVTFPPMPPRILNVSPQVTVTVRIPGTNVARSITVTQTARRPRNMTIMSGRVNWYGTLSQTSTSAYQHRGGRMREELMNTNSFGASGVVISGTHTFVGTSSSASSPNLPTTDVNIYNANNITGAANGTTIRSWLGDDVSRVLIVQNEYSTSVNSIGHIIGALGFTGVSAGTSREHVVRDGINADTHPLLDYLFRSGPFTDGVTDISGNISLAVQDAVAGALTVWPSTFIPIIMRPGNLNQCVFGIDPVLRIVYIGEAEIFGTGTSGGNPSSNWSNPANLAFLRNICAWMVTVAQEGDDFRLQFVQ